MKKLNAAMVGLMLIAGTAMAQWSWTNPPPMPPPPTWTGLELGTGAKVANGITGGIAIGDGQGLALAGANGAVQIGTGSNMVANTVHLGNVGYLSMSNTAPWDASQLLAGSTASAINGHSITNIDPGNLTAGHAASAINGAAITNINAANVSGTYGAGSGAALTALTPANITAGNMAAGMTIGGYCPIVNDLSGQRMIQYGSSATGVVTFAVAYKSGVVPAVFLSATNQVTIHPYCTPVASNAFTIVGDAGAIVYRWMAIGQSP